MVDSFCELTLEARDPEGLARFYRDAFGFEYAFSASPVEHRGGDRSLYLEDPEGNVVEVWDFFRRGNGSRDGVDALK